MALVKIGKFSLIGIAMGTLFMLVKKSVSVSVRYSPQRIGSSLVVVWVNYYLVPAQVELGLELGLRLSKCNLFSCVSSSINLNFTDIQTYKQTLSSVYTFAVLYGPGGIKGI